MEAWNALPWPKRAVHGDDRALNYNALIWIAERFEDKQIEQARRVCRDWRQCGLHMEEDDKSGE